mmetsp:Transcript_21268/g.72028  ORF Transcript_21268/g.72028 Transcript_21268/m.72028 type:complete len:277 (+) Transcript_21268:127-957(+)
MLRRGFPRPSRVAVTARRRVSRAWESSEGKKLPRELVAACADDGIAGGYLEAMREAMNGPLNGKAPPGNAAAPRLTLLAPGDLDADRAALHARISADRGKTGKAAGFDAVHADGSLAGPWNAYVAASPVIGQHLERLGHACRHHSACAPALYEVAILAVAARTQSQFEWFAHVKLATNAGVADDAIDDIKRLTTPVAFRGTQDQRAVYAHALELTAPPNRISDATHRAALEAVGSEAALVDLVCTIGLYMQVAFLLNAFQVPMPPHVTPPFPEPDA